MYSLWELALYLILYSFAGWAVEMCYTAVRSRHFINYGFLNLPFVLPHGIAAVFLLAVLPTMPQNLLLQYIAAVMVCGLVWHLSEQFVINVGRHSGLEHRHRMLFDSRNGLLFTLLNAAVYLTVYLVFQPLLHTVVMILPDLLVHITVIVWLVLIAADFITVLYTVRTSRMPEHGELVRENTFRIADKMSNAIWRRLQKTYPGIENARDAQQKDYVFGDGICFDKLVWVLLISSFLGALIEMCFCYLKGAGWMNRSSLLYGQFSIVWGFGAVVLTIVLQCLRNKRIWMIFLAGFVIGGTYEYTCSVLSELVFGTVFWDYSDMPLNIGGRTNVQYCFYWGILAVVWLKVLYPVMEYVIEKIPPLSGKIVTWALVFVMLCNGVLTAGAMIRYTERQTQPEPQTVIAEFFDTNYDDTWMEQRWPNMRIVE
ncbi:MAG: putative ABC transporter permease [Peptococcaceae bacterium]|nr:putative ABC transporter permease [Peptococcaceae bacterium]